MPIVYKLDVLAALKDKGYTSYKLRKEKILGESVIQQLRVGEPVSWTNIEKLCILLSCDVGDLVEHIEEN
ncbi:MAG: helix-turn-helix transcriptional regulator [Oscillospiraceae bacterium]|nr:helix-turn-helix transcriptional regulator [Oscillospiraceae bacterium]